MKMNAKIFPFSVDKVLHIRDPKDLTKTSGACKHFTNVSESKSVVCSITPANILKKKRNQENSLPLTTHKHTERHIYFPEIYIIFEYILGNKPNQEIKDLYSENLISLLIY